MLRFGLICDIDPTKGIARVYFKEDDITSHWLPILVPFSKEHQFSFPFDIDEHVSCFVDENCEFGVILGAIYDNNNQPYEAEKGNINIRLAANSSISYDRNSQTLSLDIKGDVVIKSAKNVNVEAPNILVKGNMTVIGNLSAGAISATGGDAGSGNVEVAGSMKISGDATINGKSFSQHKHTVGSSTSTPPI